MAEETVRDLVADDLTIAQLADYYLNCLTYERRPEVSAWARSNWDLDYLELPGNPIGGDELFAQDAPGAAKLEGTVAKDASKELYVGYLPYLRVFTSKKGKTIYRVYPLIVRPARNPELPASFNPEALKYLLGYGTGAKFPVEELVALEDAVGMSSLDAEVDLADVATRLKSQHPEWSWIEEPDPTNLVTPETVAESYGAVSALPAANDPGIYNRAILLIGEAQKFTVGLEYELAELRKAAPADGTEPGTAIGDWLRVATGSIPALEAGTVAATPVKTSEPAGKGPDESLAGDSDVLLEPLPLNTEQREAVRKALSQKLTVITGPPGTGKSQVVSSILLNAAYRGTSVLFASKNNKAVDVVEERVNALGPRPVLLRLGSRDHHGQLAAYISQLLAMRSTPAAQTAHREARGSHKELEEDLRVLERELSNVVHQRNRVDGSEQEAEGSREILEPEVFAAARTFDVVSAAGRTSGLSIAVTRADKDRQMGLTRLAWPLLAKRRMEAVESAADASVQDCETLGIEQPTQPPLENIEVWVDCVRRLETAMDAVPAAAQYLKALDALSLMASPTVISAKRSTLLHRLAETSRRVWDTWLNIQPSLLTVEGRKLLGRYQGALNLAAGGGGGAGAAQVTKLFPKVSRHLSCWGVTSLSARGRIPLEPGFFDLLVIDEASQCDIASAIPLLHRAKRAVIIGDPMQLRHVSTLEAKRDEQLLERSMMLEHLDWSYSVRSLFDLASSIGNPDDLITLRDHHRSHADIIGFSNRYFYGGQLRVATKYENLKKDTGPAVRWIQTTGQVERQTGGSVYNTAEVQAVVAELERLANQGYRGTVGAVSPFRPQANRIRDAAYSNDRLTAFLNAADFHVGAAHSFQGDERDLMIFSPVVTRGITPGSLRFLKAHPNLFNVAVTRARAALVVVGDAESETMKEVPFLAAFRDYALSIEDQPTQHDGHVARDNGATYPDVANTEQVSEWERHFYEALYQAGIATTPQVPVENYLLDLALYDGDRRLDIEVDGEHYHRSWNGELARRDQLRSQRLIELGWDVQRFWVYQIRDDLQRSIERVREWLDDPSTSRRS